MAHRIAHCIALVATLLLLACGGADSQQALLLDEIAMQMNTAPDSALARLDSMNAETLPRHQRMRWELLRGNCLNKTDVPFTTDSLMLRVTDYFDHHGTPNQRLLAHYVLGCTYRDMGDAPRALECYHDAVAQVDTTDAGCDIHQLGLVYSQIAELFNRRNLAEQAIRAFEMAEYCARGESNRSFLLNIMENRADVLLKIGKIDEGLDIKEQVANQHQSMGNLHLAVRTRFGCITWLAQKGENAKAEKIIKEYETYSGYILPNGEAKTGHDNYYNRKGTYFALSGQLDSAELYFRKFLTRATNRRKQKLACHALCQIFSQQHRNDSLAKYATLDYSINEPAYGEETAKNLQQLQAEYDYSQHLINAAKAENKSNRRLSIILMLILGFVVMGGIVLLLFLRARPRRQQIHRELEQLRANRKNIELELQEQIRQKIDLEQKMTEFEKLKAMLSRIKENEESIRQLNLIHNQDLILLKEKDETIRSLQESLHCTTEQLDTYNDLSKIKELYNHEIIQRFQELASDRKTLPTESEWKKLNELVNTYFPNFYTVTHQNKPIKEEEYRICILTKLQFKVGDIAFLLNCITPNVTTMRIRMMNKIFNTEGKTADFDRRIRDIGRSLSPNPLKE